MKIAILNDETLDTYVGGAALVNDNIKSELEANGHEVDILIYNKDTKEAPLYRHFDYYILSNIGYFPPDILEWIMDNKRFITFRHDIPVFLYTTPPSIFYDNFIKLWQKMFTKAESTIFISPMQCAEFSACFEVSNAVVRIPPLDVSSFKNEQKPGRNGCLYVGDISMARGCLKTLEIMKETQPQSRYLFVGKILDEGLADALRSGGAEVLSEVPHEKVAKYMNEYETLYYFPEIYDSFCLKILEAQLCGMKIVADTRRIGIFSYQESPENIIKFMKHSSISHIIDTINSNNK